MRISVNGKSVEVEAGTSVAVATMAANGFTRRSVSGEPRAPLCGMGICFECRLTIDGVSQQRSCLIACAEGMEIRTDE